MQHIDEVINEHRRIGLWGERDKRFAGVIPGRTTAAGINALTDLRFSMVLCEFRQRLSRVDRVLGYQLSDQVECGDTAVVRLLSVNQVGLFGLTRSSSQAAGQNS